MLHNSLPKAFKNIYDHVLKKVAQQYTLYLEIVGKGVSIIALSNRQKRIAEIVRLEGPITGEHIAQRLNVTRAALRSDLAILIMGGILDARPKVGYYYTAHTSWIIRARDNCGARINGTKISQKCRYFFEDNFWQRLLNSFNVMPCKKIIKLQYRSQ